MNEIGRNRSFGPEILIVDIVDNLANFGNATLSMLRLDLA